MTEDQRRTARERRQHRRRRKDVYAELGKFAGLVGCVSVAILGQAELVGEPWRHILSVTAIISTAVWGYGMKPKGMKAIAGLLKRS
mgnify:CR=1 FL=1